MKTYQYTPLLLSFFPLLAQAATYNFYFNNSEQGDNSTSSPSITVKDGAKDSEAEKKPPSSPNEAPSMQQEPSPQASPSLPNPTTSTKAVEGERASFSRWGENFRLIGGVSIQKVHRVTPKDFFEADMYSSTPFWKQTTQSDSEKLGYQMSGTYFFSDYLGATLNLGSLSGIEAELDPFGVKDRLFQPGLFAGWMVEGMDLTMTGTTYIGARLVVQLTKQFGLSLAARTSLLDNQNFTFRQAEAGLSFRL